MESFFTGIGGLLNNIGKVGILALIAIFFLFVVIIISQVRSLNKIVYIRANAATPLLLGIVIIYLLLVASLFLFALAIL